MPSVVLTMVTAAACTSPAVEPAAPGGPGPTPEPANTVDLPRIPWEGGSDYYGQFPQAVDQGWTDPNFFPIGVWFESVIDKSDITKDKAIGLNTYVELTPDSDIDLVRRAGMSSISSHRSAAAGTETVGWLLSDEADMWGGAGVAPWTGNEPGRGDICEPATARCGYTALASLGARFPDDGRLRYANYGKGVHLWNTDTDAGRFVNDYTQVLSTDIYWYTDPGICAEAARFRDLPMDQCRLAANYGSVIDRERRLDSTDGKLQPIWAFVENGLPFNDGGRAITPDQMAGAVMNSLIHEARGVIYFNHNFNGDCTTQHVFRAACDPALRPATAELNSRIRTLAPVLNTQSFAYSFDPTLDTMLKENDGSYYIFAMLARGAAPGVHTLSLPAAIRGGSAEVLFENRAIAVDSGRRIVDTFESEHSYHVYKISR